jgi:hypothetical protein
MWPRILGWCGDVDSVSLLKKCEMEIGENREGVVENYTQERVR